MARTEGVTDVVTGGYAPKEGDVITAVFMVKRWCPSFAAHREVEKSAFGAVQRVTPKRVLVQTLKTSFLGFSKRDVWVPRECVRPASDRQRAKWDVAMKECDDLVRAIRDAYASESPTTPSPSTAGGEQGPVRRG
jgi:hypothetical protein